MINSIKLFSVNQNKAENNKKHLSSNSNSNRVSFGMSAKSINSIYDKEKLTAAIAKYLESKGKAGEEDAFCAVFDESKEIVVNLVHKMNSFKAFQEDLISEGNIGLWNIVKNYDPGRSENFISHLQGKLQCVIKDSMRSIRSQQGASRAELKTIGLIKELTQINEKGEEIKPTIEQVMNVIKRNPKLNVIVTPERIQELIESPRCVSIYSADAPDSSVQTLLHRSMREKQSYEEDKIIKRIDAQTIRKKVCELRDEDKKLIVMHFYQDKTVEEMADELGNSSRQTVSYHLKKALTRMRKTLKQQNICD